MIYQNGGLVLCTQAPRTSNGATFDVFLDEATSTQLLRGIPTYPRVTTDTGVVGYATLYPRLDATVTITSMPYFMLPSERNGTDFWSPVQSLVFSTNLPILGEQTSPANKLGYDSGGGASASRDFFTILTDISLPLTGGASDYLDGIQYAPQGQFRFCELQGDDSISNFSISLYWKCRLNGQLYLLTLGGNSTVSIKLMFQRKY